MATEQTGDRKTFQNLAEVLHVQRQIELNGRKLPTPSDQDILRAVLGKPLQCTPAQPAPVRKAG